MILRGAPVITLLALAACGDPPARPPSAGPEARKAVDDATAAYARCIEDRSRAAPPGGVPGTIVGRAVRACEPARTVLAARIAEFRKIGYPNYTNDQLKAVAEASIQSIEPQMRAAGVIAYVNAAPPETKAP